MRTLERLLLFLSGLLLATCGIYCLFNPATTLVSLVVIIGIMVLIAGLAGLVEYFYVHAFMFQSGWLLTSSLCNIIFGIMVLSYQGSSALASVLPYFVAVWAIGEGISAIATAFDLRVLFDKYWWIGLVFGLVCMILGIVSLFNPTVAVSAISLFVGLILIAAGVGTVMLWWRTVQAHRQVVQMQKQAKKDWESFASLNPDKADWIKTIIDRDFLDL